MMWLILGVLAAYSITILYLSIQFDNKKPAPSTPFTHSGASIICVFRNEDENLFIYLNSILQQSFKGQLQFILVDDNSTDKSVEVIKTVLKYQTVSKNVKIIQLGPLGLSGKKAGISEALKVCEHKVILYTDADCVYNDHWADAIIKEMPLSEPAFCAGPIIYKYTNWFTRMQALDMFALMGITEATINISNPIMANAANMAINHNFLIESLRTRTDNGILSGDDVFLVQSANEMETKPKLTFSLNRGASVLSTPPQTPEEFIDQRLRWAAKSKHYKGFFARYISIITFLASASILAGMLLIPFVSFWYLLPLGITLKWTVDVLFLKKILKQYKEPWLGSSIPTALIFHTLYVTYIGILSLRKKSFMWKGRLAEA